MKRQQRIVQWLERHEWLSLAGILIIFSALVAGNIGRWSIWFDESFSAYIVRFDFAKIVHFTAGDVHPPLYYWTLKCWTMLVGNGVVAMRTLSVLFSIIALVGVYMLVRRATKSKAYGLAATAIAALSPVLARLSIDMRMYTMVFAIVVWATYILLRAQEENKRTLWICYGALVLIGMLTHYFSALAWIAHWVWRYIEMKQGRIKKYFTKQWIYTFAGAVALYLWWIPAAIKQFTTVQAGGFWIPSITANTPIDYVTELLAYRVNSEATGWWAVLLLVTIGVVGWCFWFSFPKMSKIFRRSDTTMLLSLAIVPPMLLLVGSLPPLRSSFISRYVLYAQVTLLIVAVLAVLVVGKRHSSKLGLIAMALLFVCCTSGVGYVYAIGNYNKNSNSLSQTGDIMKSIANSNTNGDPVIAASQWLYYEAAAYSTSEHPVYYNAAGMNYYYGSELMLKEDNTGKISSLTDFAKQHRYVWYYAVSDTLKPPVSSWKLVKKVSVYNPINKTSQAQAGLYDTQSN